MTSEPLLPDVTDDERAVGWGDDLDTVESGGPAGSDEERLRSDRPPHHDRT